MDAIDPEFMRGLNIVLTGAVTIIVLVTIVLAHGRGASYARADRFSQRVRLPYASERMRESIARALRLRADAAGLSILAGAFVSIALLATPLATSPLFVFYTLLTALVVGNAVGTVVVNVRERLFDPAPDAPRIARAQSLRVADYLDPFRRLLPWWIATTAGGAVITLVVVAARDPARVDDGAARASVVFTVVSVIAFLALPWLERLILAQPQPATQTIELAWDDALRTGALLSLRLSCAIAAWLALSLALAALWVGSESTTSVFASQLPAWGMIALQFAYPSTGRPLNTRLYPEWLRPVVAGGAA